MSEKNVETATAKGKVEVARAFPRGARPGPDVPRVRSRVRAGRCFELAGRSLSGAPVGTEWELVHGTWGLAHHRHAWLEHAASGRVYDVVLDLVFGREDSARDTGARALRRFTQVEAARALVAAKHWGPWCDCAPPEAR
ncbi:MAG: hypothetical protein HY908_02170 [Myxococcales bacterium]|nr:hypothetical protein [Myxococcales bacterium]